MASSLEKSHSKISNFLLTILVILASLSVPLIFLGLIIKNSNLTLSIIMMCSGGVLLILSGIWLNMFKR